MPSNYCQPILENGEIDWREVEVSDALRTAQGYNGQSPTGGGKGSVRNDKNPQIYVGSWDGTFTYSWTQNPVWIVYDLLTE